MVNSKGILKLHTESFRANVYTVKYFRMIGLIEASIEYYYGIEKVTLAFYSSSGTNNGKIKGLWYPIVGIKTQTGAFTEFTEYLNLVLSRTTQGGVAKAGWLAKSLFFYGVAPQGDRLQGFSYGSYYEQLLEIGETLRSLYEKGEFYHLRSLNSETLNNSLTTTLRYPGNEHSQRENFEKFIQDIFRGV